MEHLFIYGRPSTAMRIINLESHRFPTPVFLGGRDAMNPAPDEHFVHPIEKERDRYRVPLRPGSSPERRARSIQEALYRG